MNFRPCSHDNGDFDRRDFCNGTKLRRAAPIFKVEGNILDRFSQYIGLYFVSARKTIQYCVNKYSLKEVGSARLSYFLNMSPAAVFVVIESFQKWSL